MLDKKRLGELVKEVDPAEQLDEDVEDILLQVARDLGIIIKSSKSSGSSVSSRSSSSES